MSSIRLVPLNESFLQDYLRFLNDPVVHKTTEPYKEFKPYSESDIRTWLQKATGAQDRADFAIVRNSDNVFIGESVLNEIQGDSANIRIALASAYFGQGYGFEAMKLTLQHGFQVMKLNEITLSVFEVNPRGIALYRKLGFVETGRGSYHGFPEVYMKIQKGAFS